MREGLLCGKGVEPPRGRGRLSGARESQLFFGVYYNKNVFTDIGSESFVVYLSCVYIYICSAGYAEVPVVLWYLLQCLVYHMLSKTRRSSGSIHRVIGEVLVLGLPVVVRFHTAVVCLIQQLCQSQARCNWCVPIILLSIWYNVCACHSPVYH